MLVSVLLPARNASATVREAIRSLQEQRDSPPCEWIVVDDASMDSTASEVRACGIEPVRGEGRGLVAALNRGLAHCRGDFIARMDADDLAHPDRLRLQLDWLVQNPRAGVVGSLVDCFPPSPGLTRLQRWLNSVVTHAECMQARFIESPLVHPSCIFRREALGQGWEDHGWAEDWDLLLRLCEQGWELGKVPEVLLRWRDSETRLTRTAREYRHAQMFKLRAHFLARGPLRDRPFDIWGAGPSGKLLARELEAHGLSPRQFFDVDQTKRIARGKPVRTEPPERPDEALLICAVGVPHVRDELRALLLPRGFREGIHFLFAA